VRRMSSGTGRCRRAVRWCLRALLLFTAAAGCLSAAHAPPPSSADGVLSAADAIPPPQTRRPAPAPSCDEVFVVSAPPHVRVQGGGQEHARHSRLGRLLSRGGWNSA